MSGLCGFVRLPRVVLVEVKWQPVEVGSLSSPQATPRGPPLEERHGRLCLLLLPLLLHRDLRQPNNSHGGKLHLRAISAQHTCRAVRSIGGGCDEDVVLIAGVALPRELSAQFHTSQLTFVLCPYYFFMRNSYSPYYLLWCASKASNPVVCTTWHGRCRKWTRGRSQRHGCSLGDGDFQQLLGSRASACYT